MPEEIRIPKQKRSIEKKEALKKAAVELFSTKGFHNTSSNEIAKKANVSIGTFYSYFVDKKSLYEELITDLYNESLQEITIMDVSGFTSPREFVRKYVALILHNHEYMTAFQKEISALSCSMMTCTNWKQGRARVHFGHFSHCLRQIKKCSESLI